MCARTLLEFEPLWRKDGASLPVRSPETHHLAQTSLAQQSFPNPRIKDLRLANQAVRCAKEEKKLSIRFRPNNPFALTLVCHIDAPCANVGCHTQAGFIIGFCDKKLQDGEQSHLCPATWKSYSYKLPRTVSSTLGAESQALATASGTTEWLLLMLSEI